MTLTSLLADFIQPYLDLLPRVASRPPSNEWLIVDSIIKGPRVRYSPVLYVPSLTHIDYLPKREVPIDCGIQRLSTADGHAVGVNATAIVRIADPITCRDRLGEDWEEGVAIHIRADVCEMVTGHNLSHLQDVLSENQAWTFEDDLLHYGIETVRFRIEDLQSVLALSILQ